MGQYAGPIDLLYFLFFLQLVFIVSVLTRDGPISFSGRNAANFKRALVCRWKLATISEVLQVRAMADFENTSRKGFLVCSGSSFLDAHARRI